MDGTGIEPSERGVEAARAAYGVSLERAPLAEASGTYDAVTLLARAGAPRGPRAAVAHVASLLRAGGLLLVGVPNLASVQARLGRDRWFHLDLPRHRTHFTPAGLRALLERHGFTVEREEHALLEHNPFGLWQSLVNRVTRTPSWLFNALKRNAPLAHPDALITLALLPLAPLCLLAERAFGRARRGGTIAVLARRGDATQGLSLSASAAAAAATSPSSRRAPPGHERRERLGGRARRAAASTAR